MKSLRRFFIRLSNLATGRSADQRLQDEIAEHLAFQTEENLRAGMSPAEARRQAALKFGAAQAIREGHHAEHSLPFFENLLFDLRYAVRMLLRSPGFSFIAIATMALGIGATTAIYSVIDATLLHPLPYPNPGELVRIQDDLPGVGAQDVGISVPEWRDLESSGIFQSVSVSGTGADVNLTGSEQPERLSYKHVTPNYFAVFGVDAQLGRTFDPHDATPGFNLEAVISDEAVEERIRSRPAHCRQSSAPGQRRLSRRGRHAARFSRSGLNQRGAENGNVVGGRHGRSAVSAPAARYTSAESNGRAPEARSLDCGRAGAPRCAG